MRYYGSSGVEEDTTKCIAEVISKEFSFHDVTYQCSYRRGYGVGGLFCKRHAKMYDKNKFSINIPTDL